MFRLGNLALSLVLLVVVISTSVNIAQVHANPTGGGRDVCSYCWACAQVWLCGLCRSPYNIFCPRFCAYRSHCETTCVNLCPFPETPAPTQPPTTPAPTQPPTTPAPTQPPTTPAPTQPPTTPAPTQPPTTPAPTQPPTTPAPDPCVPNPCPLSGNCGASGEASGGYTCTCPPHIQSCDDDLMNIFKRYNYDRNGPSFDDVKAEHPLDTVSAGAIYLFTLNELRYFSDIPGIHNGMQDAARHALTNYRWTREHGADIAKQFADAYERSNPNPFDELAMDLHNNAMGRQLAQDSANANRDSLEVIREALTDGTLQVRPNPRHPLEEDRPAANSPVDDGYGGK